MNLGWVFYASIGPKFCSDLNESTALNFSLFFISISLELQSS